jgi:hypothetical protein
MPDAFRADNERERANFLQLAWQYGGARGQELVLRSAGWGGAAVSAGDVRTLLEANTERRQSTPELHAGGNAVSELLAFFGVVEIACLTGYISRLSLPEIFVESVLSIMSGPEVVRRRGDDMSAVLPLMLRERLEGYGVGKIEDAPRGSSLFPRFLDVAAELHDNDDVRTFLWLLDGGLWDGYDYNDVVSVLRRPAEVMERLSSVPEEASNSYRLGLAVRGFRDFVAFSADLDELLQDAAEYPLLQAAFWCQYSRIFSDAGPQTAERMRSALLEIAKWDAVGRQGVGLVSAVDEVQSRGAIAGVIGGSSEGPAEWGGQPDFAVWEADRSVHEAVRVFERLTARDYGTPLIANTRHRRDAAAHSSLDSQRKEELSLAVRRWRELRRASEVAGLGEAVDRPEVRDLADPMREVSTKPKELWTERGKVVIYASARFLFRRDVLESLGSDDVVVVRVRPARPHNLGEITTFAMTRKEIESAFPSVFQAGFYWRSGRYSYPAPPRRAGRFVVLPMDAGA